MHWGSCKWWKVLTLQPPMHQQAYLQFLLYIVIHVFAFLFVSLHCVALGVEWTPHPMGYSGAVQSFKWWTPVVLIWSQWDPILALSHKSPTNLWPAHLPSASRIDWLNKRGSSWVGCILSQNQEVDQILGPFPLFYRILNFYILFIFSNGILIIICDLFGSLFLISQFILFLPIHNLLKYTLQVVGIIVHIAGCRNYPG